MTEFEDRNISIIDYDAIRSAWKSTLFHVNTAKVDSVQQVLTESDQEIDRGLTHAVL